MAEKKLKTKNPAIVIMKRELRSYFTGPTAYIVTGLFLLTSGILFFSTFFHYNRADLRQLFSALPLLLSLFVPALTMRLFAEERRLGSMETLMTLPVSETQVVTGKFLAAFISTLVMIAPTLSYLVAVCIFGHPDFGPVFSGYIGTLFLCACYVAIGLFASSVTKNQIISLFLGVGICVTLTMLDSFLIFIPGPAVSFFSYLAANSHFSSIARGIFDTRDLLYFVSLASLFFVLTVRSQKKAKA